MRYLFVGGSLDGQWLEVAGDTEVWYHQLYHTKPPTAVDRRRPLSLKTETYTRRTYRHPPPYDNLVLFGLDDHSTGLLMSLLIQWYHKP
jgi:hypothetical protein